LWSVGGDPESTGVTQFVYSESRFAHTDNAAERLCRLLYSELSHYYYLRWLVARRAEQARHVQHDTAQLAGLYQHTGVTASLDRLRSRRELNSVLDLIWRARLAQQQDIDWYEEEGEKRATWTGIVQGPLDQSVRELRDRPNPLLAYAESVAQHLDNQRRIETQIAAASLVGFVATVVGLLNAFA
jgi:hypothetical protein